MNKIVEVLKQAPGGKMSSYELAEAVGISSAVFYPLIIAVERAGTVVSCWEDAPDRPPGSPRRRLYSLPEGRQTHAVRAFPAHAGVSLRSGLTRMEVSYLPLV